MNTIVGKKSVMDQDCLFNVAHELNGVESELFGLEQSDARLPNSVISESANSWIDRANVARKVAAPNDPVIDRVPLNAVEPLSHVLVARLQVTALKKKILAMSGKKEPGQEETIARFKAIVIAQGELLHSMVRLLAANAPADVTALAAAKVAELERRYR